MSAFLLRLATITINELLLGSKRCAVRFIRTANQFKAFPKFVMQTVWCVPGDLQPAAFFRPVASKGRHDHVPAWLHYVSNRVYIVPTVFPFGQEMEYRPIMPDIIELIG